MAGARKAYPTTWARPEASEFQGRYVTLRRLRADADVEALYSASHGDEAIERLWRYLPYGPFAGRDDMRDWLRSVEPRDDPRAYVVFSHAKQTLAGVITMMNIVPESGRAELGGIWYAPEFQRTAVNTESVYLLLRYLFDDLGYRRVEWKCENANEPSKRAAARLGFQYEGLFRQHMVVKGRNRDTAWFSIIDSEWPRLRENFESYLSEPARASLTEMNASPKQ